MAGVPFLQICGHLLDFGQISLRWPSPKPKRPASFPLLATKNSSHRNRPRIQTAIRRPGRRSKYRLRRWVRRGSESGRGRRKECGIFVLLGFWIGGGRVPTADGREIGSGKDEGMGLLSEVGRSLVGLDVGRKGSVFQQRGCPSSNE